MTTEHEFFTAPVEATDPLIGNALAGEKHRQQSQIELIASENISSRAVLDALGHEITNKTLEGYPGNRFHAGAEFVDVVEQAVIDRARQLFGCEYVNAQPHSGTQANQAVFFATLKPGHKVLSLDLAAGGHLSHGAKVNLSGRWFDVSNYRVDRDTGLINYDELADQALEVNPSLLIAGGSAYPREIEFPRMREIADSCGAILLVDMAHFAGLVAAGVHPSPLPYADIVTCTTTKTLRGPGGGLILSRDNVWAKKLNAAIFPGVQGSMHTQVMAAKAICLGEALLQSFKDYGRNIKTNAAVLAKRLQDNNIRIVSGGTDTHIVLLDLQNQGATGQQAEDILLKSNLTSNKNPIPFDSPNPSQWVGLRLGVASATTRGLGEAEFRELGDTISGLIQGCVTADQAALINNARATVEKICKAFPIYP